MNTSRSRKLRRAAWIALVPTLAIALALSGWALGFGDSDSKLVWNGGSSSAPTSESDLGDADGYIPEGENLSPYADDMPAIANLDFDLRAAMQRAASDAMADGVEFFVTDGWRSERYQQFLFDQAVTNYLGEAEARKWVKTPQESTHVSGLAVDIGPTDANSWLSQHGSDYGLCQSYSNEMWHFELTVRPGEMCPAPRSDASTE